MRARGSSFAANLLLVLELEVSELVRLSLESAL